MMAGVDKIAIDSGITAVGVRSYASVTVFTFVHTSVFHITWREPIIALYESLGVSGAENIPNTHVVVLCLLV